VVREFGRIQLVADRARRSVFPACSRRSINQREVSSGWTLRVAVEGLGHGHPLAHVTRQRIRAVMDLMQSARVLAEKVLPKVQVPAILDVVFRHPYCKVRFLEEAGLGSRPTCTKYLRALVAAGLLREQAVWRENYFINDAFFEALAR
jgi:hypothetical protein